VENPHSKPDFRHYVDEAGRRFEYVSIHHAGSTGLVVHLSAFFGKWGETKENRDQFQGYFHRMKMLGADQTNDWLFICDSYGANRNGTYYTGEGGDLFVERAMVAIAREEIESRGMGSKDVVTMGSSMGATGALVLALQLDVAGIVAIAPHVDLDLAATLCGRYQEVAFACADGDPTSEASRAVTRRVRTLLGERSPERPLPRLFVQSMADDLGVHGPQVVPLVEEWMEHGGRVDLDLRPIGGHTSDYATRALLLDACHCLLSGDPIDVTRYSEDPDFAGVLSVPTRSQRLRRRLGLGRLRRFVGR
jgi:pimeloyl-ACP methyl ester carboxylesterase